MKIKTIVTTSYLTTALILLGIVDGLPGELIVTNGEKLAFLGDSITRFGSETPGGYAWLVVSGLVVNGVKVTPVFAGVGGNTSTDMLARVDKDVLAKKPALMTLSCGVNDVYRVPLDTYKTNITALVEKVQAAGVRLVILTATMAGEDQSDRFNQKLIGYNDFLRQLANQKGLPLADVNRQMQAAIKQAKAENAPQANKSNYLTIDGIHMAPPGDQMMAEVVLRTFGLNDAQINAAKAAWLELPGATKIQSSRMISLKKYYQIAESARAAGMPIDEFIDRKMAGAFDALPGEIKAESALPK
ncbi:MAG: GDSL-type esterase/lipase family protein [Verrucomicrobiota bacterium]